MIYLFEGISFYGFPWKCCAVTDHCRKCMRMMAKGNQTCPHDDNGKASIIVLISHECLVLLSARSEVEFFNCQVCTRSNLIGSSLIQPITLQHYNCCGDARRTFAISAFLSPYLSFEDQNAKNRAYVCIVTEKSERFQETVCLSKCLIHNFC